MKRSVLFFPLIALFIAVTCAYAVNKASITKNVDSIVEGLDSGKEATSFKAEAFEPYAFIMQENGKMLVHPSLAGENLMEKAPPVYQALMNAKPEGVWVEYEWKGKIKHTYAKKTKSNLIVGSGY